MREVWGPVWFVTALCAIALTAWRSRPEPAVNVQLTTNGLVQVDGDVVEWTNFKERIHREVWLRNLWRIAPQLVIKPDENAEQASVVEVIRMSHQAGFERVVLVGGSVLESDPK